MESEITPFFFFSFFFFLVTNAKYSFVREIKPDKSHMEIPQIDITFAKS